MTSRQCSQPAHAMSGYWSPSLCPQHQSSTRPRPGQRVGDKSPAWTAERARLFQGPEPAPVQETLAPLATQMLSGCAQSLPGRETRTEGPGTGRARVGSRGRWRGRGDRLHSQASAAAGRGQAELPDALTLVGQRQRAVEVALLRHPRGVVGLAGDPAGARAAHPDSCEKGDSVSPSRRGPGPRPACHGRPTGLAAPGGLRPFRRHPLPIAHPGVFPENQGGEARRDSCPAVQKRRAPTVTQRIALGNPTG